MTVYLSNRDGDGKTNEEGHLRLLSKVLEGQVLSSSDLLVTENSPLAMNILVQEGDYRLETAPNEYAYMGWLDGASTVTITAADPSNPRITVIVLYVDKLETTAAIPPNNPGIAKLMAVNGAASSSPVVPSGAAIQSAVGSGNPYMVLAQVAVGTGVTTISNGNITDTRTVVKLNDDILSPTSILQAVGPLLYPVGSLYYNANVATNPGTLLGFGTWSLYSQGRTPVGIDSGDTDFGTLAATPGSKTVTLTEAQMPNHTHGIDPPTVGTSTNGWHSHGTSRDPVVTSASGNSRAFNGGGGQQFAWSTGLINADGNHTHTVDIPAFNSGSKGNSQSHTNIQPSVVVYIWRRTA